ncbi:FMN-binding protein [Micromonospora sp. NPDC049679]|uniref:FMN-binding protein n=1 Tax=Micromonospora sp. NPDC049679 TaxID=3155920 RepID=UPI0033D62CA9
MRRAVFAITALAASTTLLVVFKGGPAATEVAQNRPAGRTGGSGTPAIAGAPPTGPRSGVVPTAGTGASRPAAPRQTGKAPAAPPPARKAPAPPANTPFTVTGPIVTNNFGQIRVRVTMTGSRITNVTAVALPRGTAESSRRSDSVDDRYSGNAGQAVSRQGANLDTVSGATATSDSYRSSLAAAIDAAAAGRRG